MHYYIRHYKVKWILHKYRIKHDGVCCHRKITSDSVVVTNPKLTIFFYIVSSSSLPNVHIFPLRALGHLLHVSLCSSVFAM